MLHIRKIAPSILQGNIVLPVSKSIANRALVIRALSGSKAGELRPGESHDTALLRHALFSGEGHINFEDAGTPLRLFLAYAALRRPGMKIDGNARLKERPVEPLLKVLEQMGSEFEYMEKPGCLPLKVRKTINTKHSGIDVNAGLSSQFLSALLLVAPYMENGLEMNVHRLTSMPYVRMTMDVMRKAGIAVEVQEAKYIVNPGEYNPQAEIAMEPDWSAAAHVYALVSAATVADVLLEGLSLDSVQGDKAASGIFRQLGVATDQGLRGLHLYKAPTTNKVLEMDFTDTPDLFPAVAAACAFHGLEAHFTGTRNLALKESDRVEAMRSNLAQAGCVIEKVNENEVRLKCGTDRATDYSFKSFNDHRIAMACSIFAFRKDISIDDEAVVRKSFPGFWDAFFALTKS